MESKDKVVNLSVGEDCEAIEVNPIVSLGMLGAKLLVHKCVVNITKDGKPSINKANGTSIGPAIVFYMPFADDKTASQSYDNLMEAANGNIDLGALGDILKEVE